MKLRAEQVQHIAHLARLELSDVEVEKYTTELSVILSYVERLEELNTDDIPPTTHITASLAALRTDTVVESPSEVRDALVAAFPQSRAGLLVVPAVFHSYKE